MFPGLTCTLLLLYQGVAGAGKKKNHPSPSFTAQAVPYSSVCECQVYIQYIAGKCRKLNDVTSIRLLIALLADRDHSNTRFCGPGTIVVQPFKGGVPRQRQYTDTVCCINTTAPEP